MAHHGEQIFIYHHRWTNQVIYSLTRALQPKAIKQLPFLGKKSVPAKLRKDMWTPLATVKFPTSRQGIEAYRRLREYKIRHHVDWRGSRPGLLEKERRERKFELMNQRATSVADLAAVLEWQGRCAEGQKAAVAKNVQDEAKQRQELMAGKLEQLTRFLELHKAGEMEKVEKRIRQLQARLEVCSAEQRAEIDNEMLVERQLKNKLNDAAKLDHATTRPSFSKQQQANLTTRTIEDRAMAYADRVMAGRAKQASQRTGKSVEEMERKTQSMSLEGVSIQWKDVADSQYVDSWPQEVTHSLMGYVRHTAQIPNKEPVTWEDLSQSLHAPPEEAELFPDEANAEGVQAEAQLGSEPKRLPFWKRIFSWGRQSGQPSGANLG